MFPMTLLHFSACLNHVKGSQRCGCECTAGVQDGRVCTALQQNLKDSPHRENKQVNMTTPQGCPTEAPQTDLLGQYLSHSSGDQKSEIKVRVGLVPFWSFFGELGFMASSLSGGGLQSLVSRGSWQHPSIPASIVMWHSPCVPVSNLTSSCKESCLGFRAHSNLV